MNVIIDHVPLIDGLKPNLINISQIGDKVINVCFTNKTWYQSLGIIIKA